MDNRNAEHLPRARSSGDASPSAPLPHPASEHLNYFHDDAPQNACPVRMSDNKPCGRDLYTAPSCIEKRPVCLMHSCDPRKDATIFWKEIKAILDGSSAHHRPKDYFDFRGFVFLAADFSAQEFAKHVDFSDTTFTQAADFRAATFTGSARFYGATFSADAKFGGATFIQGSDFGRVTFAKASFVAATFTQLADFSSAEFFEDVSFWKATFGPSSSFFFATFTRDADFSDATFAGNAAFSYSTLQKALILADATFGKKEEESPPLLPPVASSSASIADFSNATFENPALIRFFQVNKKSLQGFRARFLNCPVEQCEFTDVHWLRRWGRVVLQDDIDLYASQTKKKRTGKEEKRRGRGEIEHSEGTQRGIKVALEYTLVAKLYRQLVNNFEKNCDYDLAEDCYVGAMEMQRLVPQGSLWTRFILRLYKSLSNYGSSVPRAFLWALFFVLVFFPTLYTFTGIRVVPGRSGTPTCNYPGPAGSEIAPSDVSKPKEYGGSAIKELAYTCASAIWLSLEVATFQKNTTIEPATVGGRHITTIETIIAPGQFALFFLAIRRRFKR